jgi:hypothetical protein
MILDEILGTRIRRIFVRFTSGTSASTLNPSMNERAVRTVCIKSSGRDVGVSRIAGRFETPDPPPHYRPSARRNSALASANSFKKA